MKRIVSALPLVLVLGCAATLTRFEQYSPAMTLSVDADSSVTVGCDDKFFGVLGLGPIFEAENGFIRQVKVIENYGLFYVVGEGFRRVWIIEPKSDGMRAKVRGVDVTPKDEGDVYADVSLSRYGSRENAAVRFRFNGRQVFIDRKGRAYDKWNR